MEQEENLKNAYAGRGQESIWEIPIYTCHHSHAYENHTADNCVSRLLKNPDKD